MAQLDVERKESHSAWWLWLLIAILVIAAIWWFFWGSSGSGMMAAADEDAVPVALAAPTGDSPALGARTDSLRSLSDELRRDPE